MLHSLLARSLAVCVTVLAVALPLAAQTVTPGNRVLVIDAGKTASIKVQDTDGCTPTWTATSSDTGVATVSPASAKAGKTRSFKVKAEKGVFGATCTVTITMDGTGSGCGTTTDIDVTVVVVRNQKHAEQMTRKSANMNLKAARKERKLEEKALVQQFNDLLSQTKQDLAQADSAEGPSQSREQIVRSALINSFIIQLTFLAAMMNDFVLFSTFVQFDAYNFVINYAYLPFLAVTLLVGGGGIWDAFVANLIKFSLQSVSKAFKFHRTFLVKLAILAVASGVPLSFGFLPFQQALCFPPVCGPSGVAQEEADVAEGGGILNPVFKLQMLMILTWTHFLASPEGSIAVGGLADPLKGDVAIKLLPASGGSPIEGTAVVNPITGVWWLLFGTGGTGSPLVPGKYTVEITQDGVIYLEPVDVPRV